MGPEEFAATRRPTGQTPTPAKKIAENYSVLIGREAQKDRAQDHPNQNSHFATRQATGFPKAQTKPTWQEARLSALRRKAQTEPAQDHPHQKIRPASRQARLSALRRKAQTKPAQDHPHQKIRPATRQEARLSALRRKAQTEP